MRKSLEYSPINEYDKLASVIRDKKVLYIPIVSAEDKTSKKMQLTCDGNVNRFITTFLSVKCKFDLTIFLPKENDLVGDDTIIDKFIKLMNADGKTTKIVFKEEFHKNAGYQRSDEYAKLMLEDESLDEYDVFITEGQGISLYIARYARENNKTLVYWCPTGATDKKCRSFHKPNIEKDKELFVLSDFIIIAAIDQYAYLTQVLNIGKEKVIRIETLIDRKISLFSEYKASQEMINLLDWLFSESNNVFFFPFRLHDEGYRFAEFLDALYEIQEQLKYDKNYYILYTNPSNVDEFSPILNNILDSKKKEIISKILDHHFIKVPSDRDSYYTIIDYNNDNNQVIIPYLEDIDFVNHSSIHEFLDSNANIFTQNSDNLYLDLIELMEENDKNNICIRKNIVITILIIIVFLALLFIDWKYAVIYSFIGSITSLIYEIWKAPIENEKEKDQTNGKEI